MKTAKQIKRDAKRLYRLCLVNELLDESRVRQAAQAVIGSNRRGSRALLHHFLFLVKLDYARRTAEVESATQLPYELRASIQADLERLYGPGLSASFAQNPDLIGGMRIKVGSDVYDGSVKAGLAALEKGF